MFNYFVIGSNIGFRKKQHCEGFDPCSVQDFIAGFT